jgi:hypothetical protein
MSELGNGPLLPPKAGGGIEGPAMSGIGTCRVAGLASRRSLDVRHVHDEAIISPVPSAVKVEYDGSAMNWTLQRHWNRSGAGADVSVYDHRRKATDWRPLTSSTVMGVSLEGEVQRSRQRTLRSERGTESTTDMMMSNCLRLPFASSKVSSPRSTRKMILRQWPTVMLVFACLVVKWMRELQSGTWRLVSKCQGPIGLSSAAAASSMSAPASSALTARGVSGDDVTASTASDVIGSKAGTTLCDGMFLSPSS